MKKIIGDESNSLLTSFTHGLDIDQLMYRQEISVQKAWCAELVRSNYLEKSEGEKIFKILEEIQVEMADNKFEWSYDDEDIHMNIERVLTQKLGVLGEKIHLGRSRNDLVATTQRLFVHDQLLELENKLQKIIEVITLKAEDFLEIIVPGMTHLQSGQPIRYGQILLAHAHGLVRDKKRFQRAREEALSYLPLGAAAFSGTHLKLDLVRVAKELGFRRELLNSYDAVGDRDFILESLNAMSLLSVHLNRFCHETIYYSSSCVGLLILPKNWSTGSSIMPNKRNPDVLEISRAKLMRVIACSSEGLNLVAQVTPSYGSDLHELKRTFWRAFQELDSVLEILKYFIQELTINSDQAAKLCEKGHLLATEWANYFVAQGEGSFREAYLKIKEMVAEMDNKGLQIHDHPLWPKDLNFKNATEARDLSGGTSYQRCQEQINYLKSLN